MAPRFLAPLRSAALTVAAIAAAAPVFAQASHAFVYVADRPLRSVSLAGSFNNWNKSANPMKVDADNRTWRLSLPLSPGRYSYKFVLDNETWVTDPGARSESDGNGNSNSILLVLPADYNRPAQPDDGVTAASALRHDPTLPDRNYDRGQMIVALRARPDDLSRVEVVVGRQRFPMEKVSSDEFYARYTAHFPWNRKSDLTYSFALTDGATVRSFGANGISESPTGARPFVVDAKTFRPFVVPDWVEKTVFYQIFPDRFDNGDRANDPPDVQQWNARPQWFNRFGGDVAGVRKHLDYLSGLKISGVYFNPVFASPSNHRYDARDYKTIDPQFGTNAEFAGLTRELSRRGIRTVMDFVFNHTATDFFAFDDVKKNGASSAYANWYFVHAYPIQTSGPPNYDAWYGFGSMPKLNVTNPPTRDYLLGLVNYWDKSAALSGMRLDVASEVDPRFWRALRTRAKTLDPQMWIVGEVWGDGSSWLGGDQWDSVMNYQFRDSCLRFFADGQTTPTQFMARLMAVHHSYTPQVSRNLMNLLSSHDTPRFLTQCHGDADLDRLAAVVQFTWVGAPSIYYGEEVGMEGGADPDNRRGMRWDLATLDNPMLRFYKTLIATRNKSRALQSGDPYVLFTDDANGTLAYARVLGSDAAVVAINRSNETRNISLTLPGALREGAIDALTNRRYALVRGQRALSITLPPHQAVILIPGR